MKRLDEPVTGPLDRLKRGRAWRSPRRQMVAIGIAGGALNVLLVNSALTGLDRVNSSYNAVEAMSSAQGAFQDADQEHDVLHADVLQAVLNGGAGPDLLATARADVADFRSELDRAVAFSLPADLKRSLRAERSVQEQYNSEVLRLTAEARANERLARAQLPAFNALFIRLRSEQAHITKQFAAAVEVTQAASDDDERGAVQRILAAAAASLIGFFVLALLVIRLGRRIGVMVARERSVAETLQHSLLPEVLPEIAGVQLAARYVPGAVGTDVGGDWYDVFPLLGGQLGLVMGDVAGHDLAAAVVMGQMRHALRAYAAEGHSPGAVLERLNQLGHQQHPGDVATCLFAVIDPVTMILKIANAGHYPPLVVWEGRARYLESDPRPPIGALREVEYPVSEYTLSPGSTLLLFTDGLFERRGTDVAEELRLLAKEAELGPSAPDAMCQYLLDRVLGLEQHTDDVAILAIAPAVRLGERLELLLPAEPNRLADLRRAVGRWLDEWGADEMERYELTLACNEAASNAIEHAYGPGDAQYQVTCLADPGTNEVVISVVDWGRWRDPRGEGRGRGLRLMEALTDELSVTHGGGRNPGTVVRLRRRLGASAAEPVEDRSLRSEAASR